MHFSYFVDGLINFLSNGLLNWSWWEILLYTLVTTHITIVGVTVFLHRSQAHRALDLHPWVMHFFRFWLWITTGMQTKAWVAIHRKHHAKCETEEDPHSPQTRGIKEVFWRGAELYRFEAKNEETLKRFGHGTPDDWVENHVYTPFGWQGIGLMLVVNVLLFGALGLTVWAVQMLWIPVSAAGVINGIAHYWGYRNFESPDASTNIIPWGIVIGGEELHNNHHTYPTSAKFKVKPYEFDLGWVYIQALQAMGLAHVKKIPPQLKLANTPSSQVDTQTLDAVIIHRYTLMSHYAQMTKRLVSSELLALRQKQGKGSHDWRNLKLAKRWLHRDNAFLPKLSKSEKDSLKDTLQQVQKTHPALAKIVVMRSELQQLWSDKSLSREQLVQRLRAWCSQAEASGIGTLQEFAQRLLRVASTPH